MKRWHKVSLAVLLLVVAAGVACMVSTRKAQQAQAAAPGRRCWNSRRATCCRCAAPS